MGRDYDYIFSEGTFVWLYGVQDVPTVENMLETNFETDYPGRLWKVLNTNEMKIGINPYDGKSYDLFNQYYWDHNKGQKDEDTTTIKQPDLCIFMNIDTTGGVYGNVGYVDMAVGGANAMNIEIDLLYIPREGKVPYLVGNHGTKGEQHVPLIFHGLKIKQGYENTHSVYQGTTTMDIIPTVCDINSWTIPNKAKGSKLTDCYTTTKKWVVSPDGSGDYTSIQAAINVATSGDVVFVTSKSLGGSQEVTGYKEPITIGNSLSLIADLVCSPSILGDRFDSTPSNYNIITITSSANYVKVKGFGIGFSGSYGVYIDSGCDNNLIYGNSFYLNINNAIDLGVNNRWYNGYFKGGLYTWWELRETFEHFGGGNFWSGPGFGPDYFVIPLIDEFSGTKTSGSQPQTELFGDLINDNSYIDTPRNIEDWYPIWPECHLLSMDSDWIITDLDIRDSQKIILSGDLTITSGATLILINSELVINSLYDGEHSITIENGGKLFLSGSKIYANDPAYRYRINGNGEIIQENSDIRDVHPSSTFGMIESNTWYGYPLAEYDILVLQFPLGGGEEITYLKLPMTADILYTSFDLTGEISGSNYPTNPSIDIGNDGFIEWSYLGELTSTITITDLNTNPILAISTQDYLDNHQPDQNGFIYVPISFSSESKGKLVISNIKMGYTYRWTSGIFSKDHIHAGCYHYKFTVDIYYTREGGIRIDDSSCPNIDYSITIADQNWGKPATIKHYYYDEDNNGLVDGTTIPESTLKMYWWDENTQGWVPTADVFSEENTGVNTVNNYVWTNVDSFSSYTTNGSYVPIAETEALIETVNEMDITEGIKNSLKVKLETTLGYLSIAQDNFVKGDLVWGNENLTLANNKLNDFINEVEAQRGKAISEEDAVILINSAQGIIDLIDEAYV